MSKAHRGKGIRDQVSHGKGECPVCKRNNVKILYEMEAGEQKFKICKTCKAAIKNGNKKLPVVEVAKPAVKEDAVSTAAEKNDAAKSPAPEAAAETAVPAAAEPSGEAAGEASGEAAGEETKAAN